MGAARWTVKTREGCEVTVERVGAGFGLTIKQRDGRAFTFACGADEARAIAHLALDVTPGCTEHLFGNPHGGGQ